MLLSLHFSQLQKYESIFVNLSIRNPSRNNRHLDTLHRAQPSSQNTHSVQIPSERIRRSHAWTTHAPIAQQSLPAYSPSNTRRFYHRRSIVSIGPGRTPVQDRMLGMCYGCNLATSRGRGVFRNTTFELPIRKTYNSLYCMGILQYDQRVFVPARV